jgi:hypothetical protein
MNLWNFLLVRLKINAPPAGERGCWHPQSAQNSGGKKIAARHLDKYSAVNAFPFQKSTPFLEISRRRDIIRCCGRKSCVSSVRKRNRTATMHLKNHQSATTRVAKINFINGKLNFVNQSIIFWQTLTLKFTPQISNSGDETTEIDVATQESESATLEMSTASDEIAPSSKLVWRKSTLKINELLLTFK